ncbi:MAG: aminotransferase class V-fold PLP-dependent enzyme, partial [Chloroflexales bacterium]|nr:aminotransferase class V-fold PLP-dependent enzyme [Chloroflexales bacterium]
MTTARIDSLEAFRAAHPAYDETAALDDLRAREHARLDAEGQVYLDYTGGGLYADSQLRAHLELLRTHTFGNPHSCNPTSQAATALCEGARAEVLRFFRADPQEYAAIFTLNASGALKLVGEAFPFAPGGRYLLSVDNHNSVNGIREFARARGAEVTYLPVDGETLRLDPATVQAQLERLAPGAAGLFAYPAQSNFSGVQHDLGLIAAAQARGWDVLLDAAAFVPTNRLDLSIWKPDFVSVSFYKLFGYPTGIGALLARRTALARLRRPWFAGGTITIASAQGGGHFLADGATGFEDGTISYLGLPAVSIGLRHLEAVGVELIHQRVELLTGWLLDELGALRHR